MSARLVSTMIAMTCVFSSAAMASADLEVWMTQSGPLTVYEEGRLKVKVKNNGASKAKNVELTVQLPETATSPQVHLMGTLGAYKSNCSLANTTLVCDLRGVRPGKTKTVWFDIALPPKAGPYVFGLDVTTTSSDANLADNSADETPALEYIDTPIAGPVDAHNRHCTGQGLTAFFECVLYPSSISTHDITLEADGSITFANAPATYSGTWSQVLTDRLALAYYEDVNGQQVLRAAFHGYGVGDDCFEGLTIFPGSPWVAPYEVCLQ